MIQIHGDGVPMIKRIKAPSLLDDMDQPVLLPVDVFEKLLTRLRRKIARDTSKKYHYSHVTFS